MCIFFSTTIFVPKFVILLCPLNCDCRSKFALWNLFVFFLFQKNIQVYFITADVLTKLPTETSTAKPKNCSFNNREFTVNICMELFEDFQNN